MDFDSYTDRALVDAIIRGDNRVTEYFFYRKCSHMLSYIRFNVLGGRLGNAEAVSELFLYLAADDWAKLRQFDFRSSLTTWLSVVAIRFFIRKRDSLIENDSSEALLLKERDLAGSSATDSWATRLDLRRAIDRIPNGRYRRVIRMIDLEGFSTEDAARALDININNLYNLHRRALAQLSALIGDKNDWYD